jgi:hypothetical protein
MATSAISQTHVELSHAPIQVAGAFPGYLSTPSAGASLLPEADRVFLPESGLSGARALMTAIGFEAMMALCVLGAWRLWHLVR